MLCYIVDKQQDTKKEYCLLIICVGMHYFYKIKKKCVSACKFRIIALSLRDFCINIA